ncbi:alpha-(1,3)-fucosyltransferase 4-like [Chiloscyllium plagiosum]|uniref:alpha-(1,3)-fucosyltransferase 4-like n=1 Tax=Chiloscyllium plagiosum TaxID=36176 RepID=UPI001CB86621|nr:alpha-(1,3)-fucosyltransferase 4-like [Chiloscyllium plagiosum]
MLLTRVTRCALIMRRRLCQRLSLALSVAILLSFYKSVQDIPQIILPHPLQKRIGVSKTPPTVTVLIWWYPFGKKTNIRDCNTLFKISGCRLTTNRQLYPVSQAVIIHHRDLTGNGSQLPAERRPSFQRWVWMNFESPTHSSGLEKLNGVFNWTMSYKRDSDIFIPYGYLYPKTRAGRRVVLPAKNKLVVWVISNWNEEHYRVKYYHQLSQYVHIDVYGKYHSDLQNNNVVQTVSRYKFYLAFENSQHVDYITEKLWRNALMSGTVPIVLGPSRANYEQYIPPDSFIHVNDFSNPKKLAEYLLFLDKNESCYQKYFDWKRLYSVHLAIFWEEPYCKVCQAVKSAKANYNTISNLASWFQ